MPADKRAVQHELRFEILKQFTVFDSNGDLLPERHAVWGKAPEKLSDKINTKQKY